MKNVQIPYDLFVALVEYHLGYDDEYEDEIRQGSKHPLHRGVGITAAKACQGLPDALYQAGAEQGVKHPLGGGASQQAR